MSDGPVTISVLRSEDGSVLDTPIPDNRWCPASPRHRTLRGRPERYGRGLVVLRGDWGTEAWPRSVTEGIDRPETPEAIGYTKPVRIPVRGSYSRFWLHGRHTKDPDLASIKRREDTLCIDRFRRSLPCIGIQDSHHLWMERSQT